MPVDGRGGGDGAGIGQEVLMKVGEGGVEVLYEPGLAGDMKGLGGVRAEVK